MTTRTASTARTGDPIDLCDEDGLAVARGLAGYDATGIPGLMGRPTRWVARGLGRDYEREVVHRDDLVVLADGTRDARPSTDAPLSVPLMPAGG